MQNRRQPEIIAGRINADGSIAASTGFDDFTTSKGSVGVFSIFFRPSFRLVDVTYSGANASTAIGITAAWGTNSIVVNIYNSAMALGDIPFSFTAIGVQQ